MTVWEFIRPKLTSELIANVENLAKKYDFKHRLVATTAKTKREQALEILAILASNNVAVPTCDSYGKEQKEHVENIVVTNIEEYPDLAFVMFTSGTTGEPKGVMLSHENIIQNILGIDGYFNVHEGEKILIARPLVHIAVLTGELLFGLYKGLEIDFFEEGFQAKRLASYIDNNNINMFCCTPTLIYHLSNYLVGKTLKSVALSGERLSEKVVNILKDKYSNIDFYNVYGLTENSPRVSALLPREFFEKVGSVGKPIANTEIKIENGELLVKSRSVMQGYLGNSNLTNAKIIGGYLLTGDLASIDNDGNLNILGRKDDMIIRSGLNIYPSEIEQIVNDIKGVKNCLVYGEEEINYGQKICLKVAGDVDIKTLRKQLLEKLPPHLMPSYIEIVDNLELTLSGKVKRK